MKPVVGADPFVMLDPVSKKYYCYATGNTLEKPFLIYESDDLNNWSFVSYGLDRSINDWGKDWFWAPECYYNPNNGYYYMFYSAIVKDELLEEYFDDKGYIEACKLGVAVSKSPSGPFRNITDRPIDYYPFDENYIDRDTFKKGVYISCIDADLFFEEDRIYMYFSRCCYKDAIYDENYHKFIEESNIKMVELDSSFWYSSDVVMPKIKEEYISYNGKRRADKYQSIIDYHSDPQSWENANIFDAERSSYNKKDRRWSEGSMTIKHEIDGKEKYMILYSCNNFESPSYGVGIALSDSPITGFVKYSDNPIIKADESIPICSTGHGCVINKDGQDYYFFHGRENYDEGRICYVAKLCLDQDNIHVEDIHKCSLVNK